MQDRFWRFAPTLFVISLAATFVLYAFHPGEPQLAGLKSYLAVSVPWHVTLLIVCIAQLVLAALIAGASLQRGGAAAGLLVCVTGMSGDIVHASAEGFVFPAFARALPPAQLYQAAQSLFGSPLMIGASIFTMAVTAAGLIVLAASKRVPSGARIFAGAAVVLIPVSIAVSNAFVLFAFCAYAALALTVRALAAPGSTSIATHTVLEANA